MHCVCPQPWQGLALGAECGWGLGKGRAGAAPCPHGLWSPGLPHAALRTSNTQRTRQAPSQPQPSAPAGQALQENTWLCTQKGVRGPSAWSACQGLNTGSPWSTQPGEYSSVCGKEAPLMLKPQKCWYAASEIYSLYSPQGYAKAMNN